MFVNRMNDSSHFSSFKKLAEGNIKRFPNWYRYAAQPVPLKTIKTAEEQFGIEFPEEYVYYIRNFGDGDFGKIPFYPVLSDDAAHRLCVKTLPNKQNMLVICGDQAGGDFGFLISNDICMPSIVYFHHDDGDDVIHTVSPSFFDFIQTHALV